MTLEIVFRGENPLPTITVVEVDGQVDHISIEMPGGHSCELPLDRVALRQVVELFENAPLDDLRLPEPPRSVPF